MNSDAWENPLFETWTEATSHVLNSVVTANRAVFTTLGVRPHKTTSGSSDPAELIEGDEISPEWEVDLSEPERGSISVGDRITFTKTISGEEVRWFAAASGDTNPLHLDEAFASKTRFDGRIVHGTLVGGLISAALARLPGLVIYLSQELNFHNPARVGDRLTVACEIVEKLGDDQYRLTTRVVDDDTVIIDGEAVVLLDDSPAE